MSLEKSQAGQKGSGASPSRSGVRDEHDLWMFGVLASSLASRFRHHFCRRESKTCKIDKPEWAFKYLLDLANEHASLIESWATASFASERELNPQQKTALRDVDFSAGVMLQMAQEARLFV